MHDLCIFVGLIDVGVGVVTIIYVGAVGISVTVCDCVCVYCLGHDSLFKMSVRCRKMVEKCSVNGEFTNLSLRKAEEKRGDVACGTITIQSFPLGERP